MKKVLSTVLIFVAVLQIGGLTPFYFYFLQMVKDEIKVELSDKNQLDEVLVSETEYNNPKVFQKCEEYEFRFKGQMYDFQSVEKKGGNYVFYALSDQKENTLTCLLTNEFQQSADKGKAGKSSAKVLKDFFKDFVLAGPQKFKATAGLLTADDTNTFISPLFDGYHPDVTWPPNIAWFTPALQPSP